MTTNAQQASAERRQSPAVGRSGGYAEAKPSAQPGTAALEKVLLHHARTCTFWIFSGPRACSCGVIAARLELQKIREMFTNVYISSRASIGYKSPAYGERVTNGKV